MFEQITNDMTVGAGVEMRPAAKPLGVRLENHYRVECVRDGKVAWVDEFDNLVVTVGLNDSLDKHLKGSSYTAAWYVGLTTATPVFDPSDEMDSHAGWTESLIYSELVRQTLTLGSVSGGSVDNSASKAVYSINDTGTIGGAFVTTGSAKEGTAGILYGGGAFTGGNRSVLSGDTLNVTVTCTATAA